MTDSIWILEFRTDFLTSVFKLFPLLAKDYFYITIIALGYWLHPLKRIFKSLGFLIGFGISLKQLTSPQTTQGLSTPKAIFFLVIVIIMTLKIPVVVTTNELLLQFNLFLKYFIITLSIFYLIPKINSL